MTPEDLDLLPNVEKIHYNPNWNGGFFQYSLQLNDDDHAELSLVVRFDKDPRYGRDYMVYLASGRLAQTMVPLWQVVTLDQLLALYCLLNERQPDPSSATEAMAELRDQLANLTTRAEDAEFRLASALGADKPDKPATPTERARLFAMVAAEQRRRAETAEAAARHAAATVAELVAANNQVAAINADLTERVADLEAKPTVTWIATSDQLPQTELRVLAVHNDGRMTMIIRAMHIDPLTVACSDFDQDMDVTIYDPVTERNYYPAGWYEVADNGEYAHIGPLAGTVTHWAKLPKLPAHEVQP